MLKKREVMRIVMSLIAILGLASGSYAAFIGTGTYVDATTSNTTHADGSSAWSTPNNVAGDNLWWERTGLGATMNDTIFVDDETENAPMIKMTLTGLTPDVDYYIYAIWHDHGTTIEMFLAGGLSSDDLTQYDGETATRTGLVAGAEIQATADGSGEITAYIDDYQPGTTGLRERTRFDGLSYLEVPEPVTLSILALGGLLAVVRRRKK